MKKYIIITIFIVIMLLFLGFNSNIEKEEILTKNEIFDIIDNVEKVALCCMSSNGEIEITQDDKLDFMVRYIIENREKYIEYIKPCQIEYKVFNGTPYFNFGKVTSSFFIAELKKFFTNIDSNISSYKFFEDDFVELYLEPIDYIGYDNRNIESILYENGFEAVYVGYTKNIGNKMIYYKVRYDIEKDTSLVSNVTICNSTIN